MLIRLSSHGTKQNPMHIDELIDITGLPHEWIFDRKTVKGEVRDYLKEPWLPDIAANIPLDIRMKFQEKPFTVWFRTIMEIRPGTTYNGPSEWLEWDQTIYGVRLDYQTRQGKEMWDQIAELLDRETPRHLRVPRPIPVGDRMNWKITSEEVPSVILTGGKQVESAIPLQAIAPKEEARPEQFQCDQCGRLFDERRGLWMHRRKTHQINEPMKAGVLA